MITKLMPRFAAHGVRVAVTSVEEPEEQQKWLPATKGPSVVLDRSEWNVCRGTVVG